MSTMLCAWAHVDDSAHDQYVSHVADTATRLSARAWHFEADRNPAFEGPSRDNFFTIYDVPKAIEHEAPTERSHPSSNLIGSAPKHARIDTRYYEELDSFQAEDYAGDYIDLSFLVTVTYEPKDDAAYQVFNNWLRNDLVPQLLNTPEFLRVRCYKVTRASLVEDRTQVQREESKIWKYLCIYELNSDDWLWDIFIAMGQSEEWRSIENGLEFEMKKWYLKKCYLDDGKAHDKKEETKDGG